VVYFDEIVNMKAIDPVQAGRERKVDAVIVICLAWNTTQTYSHVLEIDFKLYDTQSGLCSKQGKEKLEGSCYKEAHATFVPINFETGVANFAKKIVETIHVAAAGGE
jgi:hypothetical protein